MSDRNLPPSLKRSARRPDISIDVVLVTPHSARLAVLLTRGVDGGGRGAWTLPSTGWREEPVGVAALAVAKAALESSPAWFEQVGAFSEGRGHPGGSELSVGYVGLVPMRTPAPTGGAVAWFPLASLPALSARQQAVIDAAIAMVRLRLDTAPIAFRLLPPVFTLTELQGMYEMLLGRRLHKASFRRALQGAWLVEPTDEWRSEGRGRPAQLFRYAPRKRRGNRRGVRFDLLADEPTRR